MGLSGVFVFTESTLQKLRKTVGFQSTNRLRRWRSPKEANAHWSLAKVVSQASLMRSSAEPLTPFWFQALVVLWPWAESRHDLSSPSIPILRPLDRNLCTSSG